MSTCRPTSPAIDAAGAAPNPVRFRKFATCRQPWRSPRSPAAQLRRSVGPLSTPKAVAGRTGSSNITGNNRPSSGHFRTFPGISGHFRASSGHRRTRKDHRVPYRPSPVTPSRMARRVRKEPVPDRVRYRRSRAQGAGAGSRAVPSVAGARSRCRTRRGGWSSRAVSPVAGSRAVRPVAHSRLVTSPLTSATSRLCGGHDQAHRTPVVCQSPAQQCL